MTDNFKIDWLKIVSVTFIATFTFHLLLLMGVVNSLVDAKGFYGHFVLTGVLLVFYPLIILFCAIFVSILVKRRKAIHFFISFFVAIGFNIIMIGILNIYSNYKEQQLRQAIYEKNPQSRPLLDSKRPLSIISYEINSSSVSIVVYAIDGILDTKKSTVKIKSDAFANSKVWGVGKLKSNGKLAPDKKRVVYFSTINFSPPKNWKKALVIITGKNKEFEFITIYPSNPNSKMICNTH